jgi:hypothetical protein
MNDEESSELLTQAITSPKMRVLLTATVRAHNPMPVYIQLSLSVVECHEDVGNGGPAPHGRNMIGRCTESVLLLAGIELRSPCF